MQKTVWVIAEALGLSGYEFDKHLSKKKDAKNRFPDKENQDKGKKSFAREKSKLRKDIFFKVTCISVDEWFVEKSLGVHTLHRSYPAHLLPLRAFHLACLGVADF